MNPVDYGLKEIVPAAQRANAIYEQTIENAKSMLPFGIEFLDKVFGGIMRSDIILLGARSGAGKTTIVSHIAAHNARIGKQVVFFALEADDNEVETRIAYTEAARLYYADQQRAKLDVTYENFVQGKLTGPFDKYFLAALENTKPMMRNLQTYYRSTGRFSLQTFEQCFRHIEHGADLIIIDHINYFDTDGKNENAEFTQIIKTIRDKALLSKIPVIVISHLKKKDRSAKQLLPDVDDFHGTSNLNKICTKAILIEPKYSNEPSNRWETYMRIGKYRLAGHKTRFVGVSKFDIRNNSYDKEFELGMLTKDGSDFKALHATEYPAWTQKQPVVIPIPPPERMNWYDTDHKSDF